MRISLGRNGNSGHNDWENYKFDVPRIVERLGLNPDQSNDELTVFCPFHKEGKRGNLGINAVSGLWNCWSCGAKGNLPSLISRVRSISYKEAVEYLIDIGSAPTVQEVKEQLQRELDRVLSSVKQEPLPVVDILPYRFGGGWWSKWFERKTIRRFSLGFDNIYKRAVIPVGFRGSWVGTIKRAVNERQRPRYLYGKDFIRGRVLYPWDHLPERTRGCILVEGPRDALKLHSYGIETSLAVLGSGITAAQAKLVIENFDEVTVWMDNDIYGHLNNLLVAQTLAEYVPRVYVAGFAENVKDQFELSKAGAYKSLRHKIHWSYLL